MIAGTSSGESVSNVKTNVGNIVFDFGEDRRVSVQKFRGKKYVDIRLYYPKGDDMVPGKKGITLESEQWQKLIGMSADINKAVSSMKQ